MLDQDIFSVARLPSSDDKVDLAEAGHTLCSLIGWAEGQLRKDIFGAETTLALRRGSPDQIARAAADAASVAIDRLGPDCVDPLPCGGMTQIATYASTMMIFSSVDVIRAAGYMTRAVICARLVIRYGQEQFGLMDDEKYKEYNRTIAHFRAGARRNFMTLIREFDNPADELFAFYIKTRYLKRLEPAEETPRRKAMSHKGGARSALADLVDDELRPYAVDQAVKLKPAAQPIPLAPAVATPVPPPRKKIEHPGYEHLVHAQPHAGRTAGVADAMRQQMPWARGLIRAIGPELRMRAEFGLRPTLLVGPPGSGKSAAARIIAEAAGVHFEAVNAAGMSDNRDFSGTASGYRGAHPSRPVDAIARSKSCNPIILIDEIEKESEGRNNGKIAETLITMMEPETGRKYYDDCLRCTIDLSHITWILTANSVKGIPWPLLSRLRIVQVDRPGLQYADQVIETMRVQVAQQMGGYRADLSPELLDRLRRGFWRGADIRRVRAAIMAAAEIEIEAAVIH
ncbi:MAG: AAA family ATPase [Niveispirillum sp.]|uniref:AAA family ATPase n=1 Tax=Niveispirillum sp. TaxID=1917217 RepID=UPI00403741C1